jgi:hypothetical protein
MDHWPCPRERGKAKKQAPRNQAQWKPNSKGRTAGGLQSWFPEPEDNIQTQTATPHWGRSWLSSCCWKTEKKKLVRLPSHLVRLRQSLCLNTNTNTGCWRSNTRTTKTEILLFLNLEFFCVCLFVCFVFCLCVFMHLSLLISLFFGGFFVLFCFHFVLLC